MKTSLYAQLVVTFAGMGTLAGCGASEAPVNATEVPASSGVPTAAPDMATPETTAMPTSAPEAAMPTSAPSAAPTGMPSSSAGAGKMPMAKDMPKGNHTQKVSDSKRAKACQGGCGEGTCGTACK